MRRVCFSHKTVGALAVAARAYRVMPHIHREIEELADVQQGYRWNIGGKTNYAAPPRQSEVMCDRLNVREARRQGKLPEKSVARRLSQNWAKDGKVCHIPDEYKTKWINITGNGTGGPQTQ